MTLRLFQLSRDEFANLKSQIAISGSRWGGRRHPPYAFGHGSAAVGAKHYATSIDVNTAFQRAVGLSAEAQQKAQQTAAVGDGQQPTATEPECGNTAEYTGNVAGGQLGAIADKDVRWALQDSNL